MSKFRILATTDLHGFIYPFDYVTGKKKAVGLAGLKPIIDRLKDENTILIDNGDVLQGSPMSDYQNRFEPEKQSLMSIALNEIGCDYYNIGNHDLNFGKDKLLKHMDDMKGTCITGNYHIEGKPLGKKYTVHTFPNGLKLAMIGAGNDYVEHWEEPENLIGYQIDSVYEYVKGALEDIKRNESVDAIAFVYHGGFEKDWNTGLPTEPETGENVGYKILSELEGIDFFISGHQHRLFQCEYNGTACTQNYCNGSHLAVLEFDKETGKKSYELIKNEEDYDQGFAAIFDELEAKTQKWLDSPLGCFKDGGCPVENEFDARFHKHPLISFFNQVQFAFTGAMLSSQALFIGAPGLSKNMTMRELVACYPFANTVVVKEMNGKVLKEYLEKAASYWTVNEENEIVVDRSFKEPYPLDFDYEMVDGIDYVIDASKPYGEKIVELKYKGKDVEENDIFTMAMTNYRATGGGRYFMTKQLPIIQQIEIEVTALIREYIEKNQPIVIDHKDNIKVINGKNR